MGEYDDEVENEQEGFAPTKGFDQADFEGDEFEDEDPNEYKNRKADGEEIDDADEEQIEGGMIGMDDND